jgi:hypothetical protein
VDLAEPTVLMLVRSKAQRKPNAFTATSRLRVDELALLDALADFEDFELLVAVLGDARADDVFRSLLVLRHRGLAEDYGPDLWAITTAGDARRTELKQAGSEGDEHVDELLEPAQLGLWGER